MRVEIKTAPAASRRETKRIVRPFAVKEVDDAARTFSGTAAAFSLDQGGDIILPGAFKRTLSDWKRAKDRTIQLIDTHNYNTGVAVIGKMIEGAETADGLDATFEFIEDDPTADAIRKRVKGGYLNGLSIGYEAVQVKTPTDDERRKGIWRYLKEVKLLEVSVVAFPMNVDARIDLSSVKGILETLRAGSVPADVLAEAKALHDDLGALLAATPDDGSDSHGEGLAPDDPKRLALEATIRDVYLKHLGVRL